MIDITTPDYYPCNDWIVRSRENNISWDEIRLAKKSSEEELLAFLKNKTEEDYWPKIDVDLWERIVDLNKENEEKSNRVLESLEKGLLKDEKEDNSMTIPIDKKSSWQLYKKNLLEIKKWDEESVSNIENSTLNILKRLSNDTREIDPIKGLVVGNVQSGKTANMTALMSMAADWGWNFFIILSGTIDNLRKQTQDRLLEDLKAEGNLYWDSLEHLSSNSGKQIQYLSFGKESHQRYFTVCLKNSTRLKSLIEWMQKDKNKYEQLKIIVIDDEADQASINTADIEKEERVKINSLIVNLVEGNGPDGQKITSKVTAMNYISYTATPYANILNESTKESLYPKNFISVLSTGNGYFGSEQIFGVNGTENDGIDIIRNISEEDYRNIQELHEREIFELPYSFKISISWFLCATSTLRLWRYKKPISMLVHTSQKTDHHSAISEIIKSWLQSKNKEEILKTCEDVWSEETKKFTIKDLREIYSFDSGSIINYPSFEEIKEEISNLISEITSISLDDDSKTLKYSEKIHLCVDNSNNKRGYDLEGDYVRLVYPSIEDENYPKLAPAFIVVGGNTLSRGLTIEGLISTYFLRGTSQADTLMQMGRWFGYRRGYELLPRIWMTSDTRDKFEFLSSLEKELKDDLYRFSHMGESPSSYGVRVKNSPKTSWLRITAKNKMQSAEEVEVDFSGIQSQTTIFDNDLNIMRENLKLTKEFINKLGDPQISFQKNAVFWESVKFENIIEDYLSRFKFNAKGKKFNQINNLIEWVKEANKNSEISDWNIIVSGVGDVSNNIVSNKTWEIRNYKIGKVTRSRKIREEKNIIDIGVLRGPKDLIADQSQDDIEKKKDEEIKILLDKNKYDNIIVDKIREKLGILEKPQMIIYRIDKNSKSKEDSKRRENLDIEEDLIGIFINIPGRKKRNAEYKALTIKLNIEQEEYEKERREE